MGNLNYTAEIVHVPFHTVSVSEELFLMPGSSNVFPLLDQDIERAVELWKELQV